MRLHRLVAAPMALLGALVGCTHDDPVTTAVGRDGSDTITILSLAAAGSGLWSGSRTAKYLASGPFDTSLADAFGPQNPHPPYFIAAPTGCYGSTPLIYQAGGPP